MQQQINLYRLLPKKSVSQLTWKRALVAYSAVILFVLFMYVVELLQEQDLTKQFHRLQGELGVQQKNLTGLLVQYPVRDAPALKNLLAEMQDKIEKKSMALSSLGSVHFSSYLTALASIDIQNVWLTKMSFNHLQPWINLEGAATQSGAIEKFLTQLNQQSVFSSIRFAVENVIEGASSVSFQITSTKGSPWLSSFL